MPILLNEIAQTVLIESSVLVHVIAFGILLCQLARYQGCDWIVRAATICGAGLSAFGFELWLLGYLAAWTIPCYIGSSLIALSFLIVRLFKYPGTLRVVGEMINFGGKSGYSLLRVDRLNGYLAALAAIVIFIGLVACFKPSINGDETAYHWPAPLRWASMHHWAASPFRFANGPSLIQLLFLPSAFFQNVSAGHATHFFTWAVLVTASCSLGSLLATSASLVVAAFCACPVITTLAVQMQNDVGVTAFMVAAFAALVSLSKELKQNRLRQLVLVSTIFCGALSSKLPFAAFLLPIFSLFIWIEFREGSLKARLGQQIAFVFPCVMTMCLWFAHTHYLTGSFIDVPAKAVWTNSTAPTDPVHPYSGVLGLAGPPSPQKFLVLTMAPFVTWLIGNQEPFGGRTGVVIPVFLFVFLFVLRRFEGGKKRLAIWALAFSLYYYFGIGMFVIRVRYHMFVWSLWSLLSAVGFSFAYQHCQGMKRKVIALLYCVLATLSCVDTIRTMLIWTGSSPQILPQVPWLLK